MHTIFLSVWKQPPEMLSGSECSRGFCRICGGELLCQGLFFNKDVGLWPVVLLKGRLWCGCLFLWVLIDFWERLFYGTPLGWLLLSVSSVISWKCIS